MRELLPLDHPAAARAPRHVRELAAARTDPATRILHIIWDEADGYPEHAWGFEQWSVRPYLLGQGCDGTIEENLHYAALRILPAMGLDYRQLYREAYPGEDLGDWPTAAFAEELAAESIIPERASAEDLQRLLYDLYDTNHRTLEMLLRERLEALGVIPAEP